MINKPKLEEIALKEGIISKKQLQTAEEHKNLKKMRLGEALVDLGYITDDVKLQLLSKVFNLDTINMDDFEPDKDLIKEFDTFHMMQDQFVPYKKEDISFKIIVGDPYNLALEDYLKNKYKLPLEYILASELKLSQWIDTNLGGNKINEALGKVKGDGVMHATYNMDAPENNDSTISMSVNKLFRDAIDTKASDIHIMPREKVIQVRYRIDGILHHIQDLPISAHSNIASRIKHLSGMDISSNRKPQDGKVGLEFEKNGVKKEIDLRVSTLPSLWGEKITIRILDTSNFELKIENLGLLPDTRELFETVIENPTGIVLLTGPTGSGKSTTLMTVINTIKDVTKNVMTVEDPIEYQMDDITQSQINELAGMTFSKVLRAMLRQDPDIILVGEIRDAETAEIAVQAANTGHLVLSTLHTNDAASTLTRLINMGLQPYMISDSLLAVVNQRLVRKLCPHCREAYQLETESRYRKLFKIRPHEEVTLYRAVGCDKCKGLGYKGRTGLQELLIIDDDIKVLLGENATPYDITKKAVENGMRTLQQDGLEKAKIGVTSLEEVRRLVNL